MPKGILKILLPCLVAVICLMGLGLWQPTWLALPSEPSAFGGNQDSGETLISPESPTLRGDKETEPSREEILPSPETTESELQPVYPVQKPTKPSTSTTEPEDSPEKWELSARQAFVYDLTAHKLLYVSGWLDAPVEPASITKLFTAYVALQYVPAETVLTVGEEVTWIDPGSSRANLEQGNRLTVAMCIQAMMIPSGNDAAYTLAVNIGRVIAGNPILPAREAYTAFVAEMNRMAWDLGMQGSTFVNPDGNNASGHRTTMGDLLLIAKLAMEIPLIRQAGATAELEVTLLSGQTLRWRNSNLLLHRETSPFYCADAIGLKTGSTATAGKCLISAFEQGDRILLICVMGCPTNEDRYIDTLALYDLFIE